MKTASFFFLICLLIGTFSLNANATSFCESDWRSQAPRVQELSSHPEWLRLLHFRRNMLYFSSQADGKDFFISPTGNRDPRAELEATIAGACSALPRQVHQDKIKNTPVACQFPARLRWLKSKWPELEWPKVECPELSDWRNRTRAQGVKLVFSSYYANNPSSVFGHTLIRLDPVTPEGAPISPLLSRGVNFAAEVGPVNPVIYAVFGMAGMFPGKFTSIPYYYKVREYNDFDSRDLWEYELRLTPSEIEQFIDHIWELGFTHFNYYYFTENCSYHLLTALEGAVPRIEASDGLPWWVIPADSVKALVNSPEILGRVDFRPSLFRQYLLRKKRLNKEEARVFPRLVDKQDLSVISPLTDDRKAIVLDAALDYLDYKYARELLENDADKMAFKKQLLQLRSKAPVSEKIEVPRPPRPDLSHGSMRYGLLSESNSPSENTLDLEFRFSLHEWLDPIEGYPETAKIEFFNFQFRALESEQGHWKAKPSLQELKFFEVFLLSPITADNRNYSWRASVGVNRRELLGCGDCLAGHFDIQGGLSYGLLSDRVLLFGLAGGQARAASAIENTNSALVPTWTLGSRFKMTDRWLAWLKYDREYLIGPGSLEGWKGRAEMRYSPTIYFSVGAGVDWDGWTDESKGLIQIYFFR